MFGGTVRGTVTTLRAPADGDLEAHKRWAADMRVRRAGPIGRWHEPAATETWKERWTEQAKEKTSVLWSIAAGDALVGYARASFESAPVSDKLLIHQLVIDPDVAGKGYGWDA
ncbi:MAG: GNAT family N-acetyltransferase, partial [Chloroflexota bacterium]